MKYKYAIIKYPEGLAVRRVNNYAILNEKALVSVGYYSESESVRVKDLFKNAEDAYAELRLRELEEKVAELTPSKLTTENSDSIIQLYSKAQEMAKDVSDEFYKDQICLLANYWEGTGKASCKPASKKKRKKKQ